MKKLILTISLLITLTGCLQLPNSKQSYDNGTKDYLQASINFNTSYLQQYTPISLPTTWEDAISKIECKPYPINIIYCPEYTLNSTYADCDMFAYLSSRYETLPFKYFILIRDLESHKGHMIAVYIQGNKVKIYSNKYSYSNTTVQEWLDIEYPNSSFYIAYISLNLTLLTSTITGD